MLTFAYVIRGVLAPFALALVIAYVLEPVVTYLGRLGMARVWAIVSVYALVALAVSGVVFFLLPGLFGELSRLADRIPELTAKLQTWISDRQSDYARIHLPETVRQGIDDTITSAESLLLETISGAGQGAVGMAMGAFSLLLAPFLAFYMIRDIDFFKNHLVALLPDGSRLQWLRAIGDLDRILSGFIRGQLVLAGILGAAVSLIVWALGLKFALLMGIIAAVGEFIPYFGPLIAAVPAIGLALIQSPATAVKLAVLLLLLHQIEQAVLVPRVFKETLDLHPLAVVFALLLGAKALGLLGMILAVPAAGVFKLVWRRLVPRPAEP